ncbi:Protein hipA [uncultured Candidatus Thioglobus sp.]|nr:Protein hipA [uncultured Candidatus Thioglobus sp.]
MSDSALMVFVNSVEVGVLTMEKNEMVFSYHSDVMAENFISLTMPVRNKSWNFAKLHPIFQMNLPEGYLLSLIKKHFSKISKTDDFGLLKTIAPKVKGRLHYGVKQAVQKSSQPLNIEALLHSEGKNLFNELSHRFALSSAISGIMPKVIAPLEDKITLKLDDYIVKTWGDEYPNLAENEYFCLQALNFSGVTVPDYQLSKDKKLLIIKRFDVKKKGGYFGFEDMCVLQGKSVDDKYDSTNERIAKTIDAFVSVQYKKTAFLQYFKMTVMNYLLQNGDAHLKNFALLYEDDCSVRLAPVFDVVCTTAYIASDIPALSLAGSKKWWGKKQLLEFGVLHCQLSNQQAQDLYAECIQALDKTALLLEAYIEENIDFATIGEKILPIWRQKIR